MTERQHTDDTFFIGWDVGGWNCDRNRLSRDAIVVLNADLSIVGTPWRGNLREAINQSDTTAAFMRTLFTLCAASPMGAPPFVTLAIDAALGFSVAFTRLVQGHGVVDVPVENSATNPYLHRQSELRLFKLGHRPLSPVKDMIGSQATKAMHVVAKFAPTVRECGVWCKGKSLTVIEAYPAPCKKSESLGELRPRVTGPTPDHDDLHDALTCALVAYLFARERSALAPPDKDIPKSEGWIWVPRDVLPRSTELAV